LAKAFVPSKAASGFGFSLQNQALLFLWGAGGAVISSQKRISHQRHRDRSGGQDGVRLYVNESSSRQLYRVCLSAAPQERLLSSSYPEAGVVNQLLITHFAE
jgi:hypothetical protein